VAAKFIASQKLRGTVLIEATFCNGTVSCAMRPFTLQGSTLT
jgi:hypothetical protein